MMTMWKNATVERGRERKLSPVEASLQVGSEQGGGGSVVQLGRCTQFWGRGTCTLSLETDEGE